jgi:hypothetical protein
MCWLRWPFGVGTQKNAVPPTPGELDRACSRFLAALPLYVGYYRVLFTDDQSQSAVTHGNSLATAVTIHPRSTSDWDSMGSVTTEWMNTVRLQCEAGGKISAQMEAVIDSLEALHPHKDWAKFRTIPYDRIAPMRNWLNHRFAAEPPSTPVAGLWFGLCHTTHGSKSADLSVSASARFSADDPKFRWARDPEYQPDYRFARSQMLWKIYQYAHRNPGGLKQTAERPLCFAYSVFAIARLMSELEPRLFLNKFASAGVAVGFEQGEAMLLGELNRNGFRLANDKAIRQRLQPADEKLVDRDSFWKLISDAIAATRGNLDAFEKTLTRDLSKRTHEEIREFSRQFCELLEETCNWDVYGAATAIGCGSEDGFMDFRRWIVFQGRQQFTRILADPDYLGTYDRDSDPVEHWYSEFHPGEVYSKVTGRNLRSWKVSLFPAGENPYPTEGQIAKRFPKLWNRMRRAG